jgi:TonB family protein
MLDAMKLTIGVIGALLLWSAPASAQVQIVSGGPRGAKTGVLSSLRSLDGDLKVCWRGKRPSAVRVALTVARDGKVVRSAPRSRGPVAQCAAGVLAVQTMPASSGSYRMTISIPTRRMAGKTISAALRPHVANLRSCYDRNVRGGKPTGRVALKFRIETNGRVGSAQVSRSTLNHPATHRCLIRVANQMRLSVSLRAPVWYTVSLSFDGSSSSTARRPPSNPALQPRKRGPLAGAVISQVVRAKMAKITGCYDRVARRMRRKPSGKVVIRFTIRGNGTVRNVKVRETTLKNRKIEACIVSVGKTFRFPAEAGRGLTKVWYPFSFRPR